MENMEKRLECMEDDFTQFYCSSGITKAVIGISGGKDSTIVAALMKKFLGEKKVFLVTLPEKADDPCNDAKLVAESLGMPIEVIPIGGVISETVIAMDKAIGSCDHDDVVMADINLKPRIRTAFLYRYARAKKAMVINTSNLDEKLVGYATIWGDTCGDYSPLGLLHVSQVKELGIALGVREELVNVPPADGLTGKTDEENLGFSYEAVEKLSEKFRRGVFRDLDGTQLGFTDRWPFEVSCICPPLEGQMKLSETERKITVRHNMNLFKMRSVRLRTYNPDAELFM